MIIYNEHCDLRNGKIQLSRGEAKNLANDLLRAIEESLDHQYIQAVTLIGDETFEILILNKD